MQPQGFCAWQSSPISALGAWMPASATATASALFSAYSVVSAASFCAKRRAASAGCSLCSFPDVSAGSADERAVLSTSTATARLREVSGARQAFLARRCGGT